MINREVSYERTISGSFLKVPTAIDSEFDERLMLRKKMKGFIPVEKCFFNGVGQYWYDISGLQSLDTFCHIKEPDYQIIEKMILCLCRQIEILEINLISPECILFDPEYIFISPLTSDFAFMIYPGSHENITKGFQGLMEYILTKINHSNSETVQKTYGLYELITSKGCSAKVIKDLVIKGKEEKLMAEIEEEKAVRPAPQGPDNPRKAHLKEQRETESRKKADKNQFWDKFKVWFFGEKIAAKMKSSKSNGKDIGKVSKKKERDWDYQEFYPEPKVSESSPKDEQIIPEVNPLPEEPVDFPTVCIALSQNEVKGILLYEGKEERENITLSDGEQTIGKGRAASCQIDKDTVSNIHARILKEGKDYYIEDLNSTNGTYLNEELLPYKERRSLSKNDKISFADVNYRFV